MLQRRRAGRPTACRRHRRGRAPASPRHPFRASPRCTRSCVFGMDREVGDLELSSASVPSSDAICWSISATSFAPGAPPAACVAELEGVDGRRHGDRRRTARRRARTPAVRSTGARGGGRLPGGTAHRRPTVAASHAQPWPTAVRPPASKPLLSMKSSACTLLLSAETGRISGLTTTSRQGPFRGGRRQIRPAISRSPARDISASSPPRR